MLCDLATTDRRTFTCRRCGRSITLSRRHDPARVHLQCGVAPREPRKAVAPRPMPASRPASKPVREAAANLAVLLATIRQLPDLPPWPAIERYAMHVCETGAWAGCERQRQDWARRVVEMAGRPGVWPAAWGPYPVIAPTP